MATISILPDSGWKKEKRIKEFAQTVSGYIRLLKRDGFSTGANDNGSISVWKDKFGFYRAERYFYRVIQSEIRTKKLSDLEDWLKTNWELCR